MKIGIPKEIMTGERRVAAIPETVKKLCSQGIEVFIEKGAGVQASYTDEHYQDAGAQIVEDAEDLYRRSDLILKVKEPQFSQAKNKHEIEMMKSGQYLITFLHPASPANHQMIKKLAAQGVISLSLDLIPRITRAQAMDALTSMSTVAGYKAVLMAADRLPKFMPMIGTAAGMIQPASVLVIGAGVAGLQAIATAKRLGAIVRAVDIRPEAREQVKSLGAAVVEVPVPAEIAVGEGGYAKKLPDQWLEKERRAIHDAVADSDVVILTALIPGKVAPLLVTETMVKSMRPGSIIIDVAIDQGGNCEITDPGNVTTKHGVSIDGTKNIPGMVAQSATWLFANNMYHFVALMIKNGHIHLNIEDEIIASSLVTRGGKIVHAGILEAIGE